MRGSGDTPNLSGDYSGEDTILSGEAASKSLGTVEQFLSGGDERGAVFTHRGRQRGHLSGSLTQGVLRVELTGPNRRQSVKMRRVKKN